MCNLHSGVTPNDGHRLCAGEAGVYPGAGPPREKFFPRATGEKFFSRGVTRTSSDADAERFVGRTSSRGEASGRDFFPTVSRLGGAAADTAVAESGGFLLLSPKEAWEGA
jgi:hypothetical protein